MATKVTVDLEVGITQEEAAFALESAADCLKRNNTLKKLFDSDKDLLFVHPDTNKRLGWMRIRVEE